MLLRSNNVLGVMDSNLLSMGYAKKTNIVTDIMTVKYDHG